MNNRIKELIQQAGIDVDKLQASTGSFPNDNLIALQELVEITVMECANICYNSGMEDSDAHAQNLLFEFNIDNCQNQK